MLAVLSFVGAAVAATTGLAVRSTTGLTGGLTADFASDFLTRVWPSADIAADFFVASSTAMRAPPWHNP